jgi:hypothetical protein
MHVQLALCKLKVAGKEQARVDVQIIQVFGLLAVTNPLAEKLFLVWMQLSVAGYI